MKIILKPVAILLLILLSVNSVAAVQMTTEMTVAKTITDEAVMQAMAQADNDHCHGKPEPALPNVTTETTDCCKTDCANCVLISVVPTITLIFEGGFYAAIINQRFLDNLTTGFTTSLYRPPILS